MNKTIEMVILLKIECDEMQIWLSGNELRIFWIKDLIA